MSTKQTSKRLSLVSLLAIFSANMAEAQVARCFDLAVDATPDREEASEKIYETWCYEERGNQRLIFNADHNAMRAELSGIVELDQAGSPAKVAYGSLRRGRIEVHSADARSWNPLPVPLDPKEIPSGTLLKLRQHPLAGKDQVLRLLSSPGAERVNSLRVEEGTLEARVETEDEPFDGYWWPHSYLELSSGPRSPLGKYDAYVQASSGSNPGAAAWESSHHSLDNVSWGGHCNGWAASSVLFAEPQGPVWDSSSGQVFFPSDLKGILTEASFCVHWAFYGSRYRNSQDDQSDIYPHLFHKVLLRYIGELKKPVAFDYVSGESVDNSVISGYRMTIQKVANTADRYHVRADLRVHEYNTSRTERTGYKAYAYTRSYEYDLTVDAQGEPIAGNWTSGNPDFLWVPLSPRQCGRENPSIKDDRVTNILALPAARRVTRPLARRWDVSVPARTIQKLDLPVIPGADFRLQTGRHSFGSGVSLLLKSYTLRPTKHSNLEEVRSFTLPSDGSPILAYSYGHDLLEVSLRNDTDQDLSGSIEIQNVEFLAGDGAE